MKKQLTVSAGILVFSTCGKANADVIDLDTLMLEALNGTEAVKVVEEANKICRDIISGFSKPSSTACKKIVLKDVYARTADVQYSDVKPAAIPETVKTESLIFRNCTSLPRKYKKSLNVTRTEGSTVTKSTTLNSKNAKNIGLNIKGVKLGMNESRTINFQDSRSDKFSRTVTEIINVDETVPAHTALRISVEQRFSHAYLDFSGSVVFDGKVYSKSCCGWSGKTQLLGSYAEFAGEKPVIVKGQIWNSTHASTEKSYYEQVLDPNDPAQCPPPLDSTSANGAEVSKAAVDLAAAKIESLDKESDMFFAKDNVEIPDKLVVPFISGMPIQTSNSISTVEVRAQSSGPDFCAVRFKTLNGTVEFLAPPLAFGDWMELAVHMGSVNYTITNEVLCDTGISAEIRYHAPQ